ncbi:hypothetical protein [Agrococcus sp. ProA11]|uniref:hypothetical protein n=1 Tax=Agrococcus chionoecetis TaxID=3153752 RepID=UPI003260B9DC
MDTMTITKHTPVVPSKAILAELDKLTTRGLLDLRRPNPPRWLDEWIDLGLYRQSTPAERRQIAADGLEREAQAERGQGDEHAPDEPADTLDGEPDTARTSTARPAVINSGRRVRPGTPYVACAGGCNHMLLRSKPAVAYCKDCTPAPRRKRAKADDLNPINYL